MADSEAGSLAGIAVHHPDDHPSYKEVEYVHHR